MTNIVDAWRKIASETPTGDGWIARRLFPGRPTNIQAAIRKPDDTLGLLFEIANRSLPSGASLPDCIGFSLLLEVLKPGPGGHCRLCLVLKDLAYRDVFETLANDVAQIVSSAASETEAVRLLLGRLNTWERFLDRYGVNLLSREEQAGLFAELRFLETELLPILPARDAVRAWQGPFKAAQDFKLGNMAIEIKSTTSRNPVSFKVANLEQLDVGELHLLLVHHVALSVEEPPGSSGSILPDAVTHLRGAIASTDPGAATQFDASLIEAGYLDIHAHAYENRAYNVEQERWFEVRTGFPSLTPASVPPGVTTVKYSIALAACATFTLDAANARGQLKARLQ